MLAHMDWIRAQFPALSRTVGGQPVAFLDGPGGTQVPQSVIDAITRYLSTSNANAHGAFATSHRTDWIIQEAHRAMADFLGCDASEIVFGSNMTTLTFGFSRAIGRQLRTDDEILVTCLEHDANVAPWLALEEKGVSVRTVDINPQDCTLDLADFERKLSDRTRLLAITYASNAVGTINDLPSIIRAAHAVGASVFVDAVHYAAHAPIDVRALNCDFLVCSPYKFFGPHVGVLYGRRAELERLFPYKVRPALDTVPSRWETGTQNHEGMAGAIATINYLAALGERFSSGVSSSGALGNRNLGNRTLGNSISGSGISIRDTADRRAAVTTAMREIHRYGQQLCGPLIEGLEAIPGVEIYGITTPSQMDWRVPTVAIRMGDKAPMEIARSLGQQGIYIWHGNFYALNLTRRLGIEEKGGLLRIGLVHYNTLAEVNRLLTALGRICKVENRGKLKAAI